MIKLHQYQIIFGFVTEKKALPVTFYSRLERDEYLNIWGGEDVISLVDIELTYDKDYKLVTSETSVHPLK